jgi:para-nitrobenzyl esterase
MRTPTITSLLALAAVVVISCTALSTEPGGGDTGITAGETSELAGTSWRLVNITSMDDTVLVPDDPDKYTLEFGVDDSVSMRADCNRGRASWSSEAPPRLTFSPVAATLALCPPNSISEQYLKQFEWVRSYVMRDGHLFLATMADGAIIEFEPVAP